MPRKSDEIIKILTGKKSKKQIEKLINESFDKLENNLIAQLNAMGKRK